MTLIRNMQSYQFLLSDLCIEFGLNNEIENLGENAEDKNLMVITNKNYK